MEKPGRKTTIRKGIFGLVFAFLMGMMVLIGSNEPTARADDEIVVTITKDLSMIQFEETATWMVGQATITQATQYSILTATGEKVILPFPSPSIEPFYATATFKAELTAEATQAAQYFAQATLIPTLTIQEREELPIRWRADLEAATGFSHPIFDYIAYSLLFPSFGYRDYQKPDLNSHLKIDVKRVAYQGDEYVAVIVYRLLTVFEPEFWMFRLRDSLATLVFTNDQVRSPGVITFPSDSQFPDGFADRNGNGRPELELDTDGGGSCGRPQILLLEIQPNGEVVNLANGIEASIVQLVDLGDDGLLEIKATNRVLDVPIPLPGCPYAGITHYYGWDGEAYRDISATLDDSNWPEIDTFWSYAAAQNGCLIPDYDMYLVLLYYEMRGQLSEAWSRLQPQLRWEQCTPETLKLSAKDIGNFLSWIGTHLSNEQWRQNAAISSQ